MIPLAYTFRNVFRRPLQTLQLIGGSGLVILLLMLASAVNQSMQKTLTNTGNERNIVFLSAGSEESIERSEVAVGMGEVIDANLDGIRKVLNRSVISPEVHYNGMIRVKDDHSSGLIRAFNTRHYGYIEMYD